MDFEKQVIKRKRVTTQILTDEQKEKTHKIAFYLSKYEHNGLFDGNLNQGETFKKIAEILQVKINTLKNKRDQFDPYCSKKRIGWVQQAKLSDDMKRVYDNYNNKTKEEILSELRFFLVV
ncbi:hypothetical protein AN1V17_50690 [Vallitalea sediminicola]